MKKELSKLKHIQKEIEIIQEGNQVCGLCKHKTEETISCIEKQDLFL